MYAVFLGADKPMSIELWGKDFTKKAKKLLADFLEFECDGCVERDEEDADIDNSLTEAVLEWLNNDTRICGDVLEFRYAGGDNWIVLQSNPVIHHIERFQKTEYRPSITYLNKKKLPKKRK